MRVAQRLAVAAPVLACVLGMAALGGFASLDRLLSNTRFAATSRPASGEVVFADIDAASLAAIGVWPWPRDVHARLLDQLMADGAADVAFDIDFSAASNPASDAAFAAALEAAGGFALLAAFEQAGGPSGQHQLNLPIAKFLDHATAAAVNVVAGSDGRIESMPAATQGIPAVPVALSGITPEHDELYIDFGIDLRTVDRISVSDILAGTVAPARIADRQVIVGASAIELRDVFPVPRYGLLPGPLLQVAGVETLRAGRALTPLGQWPGIVVAAALGLAWALFGGRLRVLPSVAIALGVIVGGEAAALVAQSVFAVTLQTAGFVASVLFLLGLHVGLGFAVEFTQRRRAEAQLVYLARHDAVTGLPSRLGLLERIGTAAPGPILLAGLTRLDLVRATLGRDVADATLRQVGKRLSALDARLVGLVDRDVFALVLWPAATGEQLETLGRRILGVLRPAFAVDGHEVHVDAVLGAASPESAASAERQLQRAELALQAAATQQAGGVTGFVPAMEDDVARRRLLDTALRQAIERGELTVVFQPQARITDGEMVGVEALVRWTSPELGAVSPAEFIPLAEETGLIVPLGRFVLAQACRAAGQWDWNGRVAVNVSATQLKLSDVAEVVADVLLETGFAPHRLDIEITESVLVEGPEMLERTLGALRAQGIGIAIDDFGTGYSSLSYLSRLSFDKLKVDQSFVRRLTEGPAEAAIVRTVIELAQRLDKTVVAEGIETEEQRAILAGMGCDIGQGWLIGKPMPAADIAARIASARAA